MKRRLKDGVKSLFAINGNAREAIEFYENTFGAKNLGIMTYGDLPEDQVFHFLKIQKI